jgi:hypothetical protein
MSRQRSDFARREIADCRYSASKFNDFWRGSEIVVDIADARVSDKRHAEQAAEKRGLPNDCHPSRRFAPQDEVCWF